MDSVRHAWQWQSWDVFHLLTHDFVRLDHKFPRSTPRSPLFLPAMQQDCARMQAGVCVDWKDQAGVMALQTGWSTSSDVDTYTVDIVQCPAT
jgi:hypothetical protein